MGSVTQSSSASSSSNCFRKDSNSTRRRRGGRSLINTTRRIILSGLLFLTINLCFNDGLRTVSGSSSVIETQTVSRCAEPVGIIVDNFEVRYSKENSSLYFDLSAASIIQGLNLTAQISLNAYGSNPLNISVDLCSVLSGVLCPLPTYNFTGSGEYAIPAQNIPHITPLAWTVPDIEAVFTIQLLDTPTMTSAACLQVTLTNTLTVGLPSVVWSTASVWIISSILAIGSPLLLLSIFSSSKPKNRSRTGPLSGGIIPGSGLISSLMIFGGTWSLLLTYQLQQMALTGVLSLNYPVVLRTWSTNFAYSLGLIFSSSVSHSIDSLRSNNGGNGNRTDQSASRFISRAYSPYNERLSSTIDTTNSSSSASEPLLTTDTIQNLIASSFDYASGNGTSDSTAGTINSRPVLASGVHPHPGTLLTRGPTNRSVLHTAYKNISSIDPGMESYTKQLGFPSENSFMTLFIWVLILLAVVGVCFGIFSVLNLLLSGSRSGSKRVGPNDPKGRIGDNLRELGHVGMVMMHRLNLIVYPAVTFLTFYQWTIGSNDSWTPIFFSVFVWVFSSLLMVDLILGTFKASVIDLFWKKLVSDRIRGRSKAEDDPRRPRSSLSSSEFSNTVVSDELKRSESVSRNVLCFFRDGRESFLGLFFGFEVLRLAFIGFGQGSPQLQVITQMIIGLIELISLIALKITSTKTKGKGRGQMILRLRFSNEVLVAIMVLNLIRFGLLEVFVKSNEIGPIVRAVFGFVFIGIDGIGFLIVFFFGVGHLISIFWIFVVKRGSVKDLGEDEEEVKDEGILKGEGGVGRGLRGEEKDLIKDEGRLGPSVFRRVSETDKDDRQGTSNREVEELRRIRNGGDGGEDRSEAERKLISSSSITPSTTNSSTGFVTGNDETHSEDGDEDEQDYDGEESREVELSEIRNSNGTSTTLKKLI